MSDDTSTTTRRSWSRSSNEFILATISAVAVVAAGCALVVVYAVGDHGSGGQSGAGDNELKYGSQAACERFVKDRLKAPGSARFSGQSSQVDGLRVTVTGSVDAQNSFGALLRSNFVCVVSQRGDGWYLESLSGVG